ncbi:hypothetical protein GCM10027416_09910 [Okibacterium endophyticum]
MIAHSVSTLAHRFLALVAGAALLAALAGCSAASPAVTSAPTGTAASDEPVVVEELGSGQQDASLEVAVEGPVDVAFRSITLKPGAGTGKHCHEGQLIAVVAEGVFTHYAPVYPSGAHVYSAGDSLVEGAGYVHEGKNEGTENVVLLVTYVIEKGEPLADTDLAHYDG